MLKKKHNWIAGLSIIALLILILDTEIATSAAKDGILLCLYTLVPSMFPFLILSSFLVRSVQGRQLSFFKRIGGFCGIPSSGESLFLIGLIGGYPIGAKLIGDAYKSDSISKKDAAHMLAFCSNAGPSFLFGVISTQFSDAYILWVIWLIHIISAILTGYILKERSENSSCKLSQMPIEPTKIIESGTKTMAIISAWVILFRIMLFWLNARVLNMLPPTLNVILGGILELTNGCVLLGSITSIPTRFIICSALLSFGGLCVLMQTYAVVNLPGIGKYFPGKVLQTIISLVLAILSQYFLFDDHLPIDLAIVPTAMVVCILIYLINNRKNSRFSTAYAI